MLAPLDVKLDDSWGLDHGTWRVFKHVYPAADVPIARLSIDETKPVAFHFEIGQKLEPSLNDVVLIAGSGNIRWLELHSYNCLDRLPKTH